MNMEDRIELIRKELKLEPHPEGGYFRETYRSQGIIDRDDLDDRFDGHRNYSTCIYFLLTSEKHSKFHRINQDEIWHFYEGSPVSIHIVNEDGEYSKITIGAGFENGILPQHVVPARSWFAAEVEGSDCYCLVGCTVAPGFDFGDFELAEKDRLTEEFPQHREIIDQFT